MRHSIILTIAFVVSLSAMLLVAGCTSPAGPTATATATPVPVTAGVSSSSLFDHSKFTTYQYKISSSDMMGMPMVHTYTYSNETLNGKPVLHANITEDMRPDMLIYLDIWSDPSTGSALNIHEIVYKMGDLTRDADIDAANYTKFEAEDLASPKFTQARLSPSGTETVTVGGNSYTATNYTGSSGDTQYAYLVSPDVPVPVKFTVHDSKADTDSTFELNQWSAGPASYGITIVGGQKTPVTVSLADLRSLPQVKEDTVYCQWCEAAGGDITTYYGPTAQSVLDAAGIPSGDYVFRVTSTDGKSIVYDRAQLANSIIALKEGNKDLNTTKDDSIMFVWSGGRNYVWPRLPAKIEILKPAEAMEMAPMGPVALNITGDVYYTKNYTLADLKAETVVNESIVGYGNQTRNVTGVYLNILIDEAVNKKDAKTVRLIGRDGYTADLNLSELKKDTEALVAFNDDGTLTAAPAAETSKPASMPFKSWVRDLVSIEIL